MEFFAHRIVVDDSGGEVVYTVFALCDILSVKMIRGVAELS